jgi:peptidoglycan/LPS O-acetylase OafA/YrhL
MLVAAIQLVIVTLCWAIWRFAEPPMQRWTKVALSRLAGRIGFIETQASAAAPVSR